MGRILIAGCGYVGTALAAKLSEAGHDVYGVRRDWSYTRPPNAAINCISADFLSADTLRVIPEVDLAVYAVSADSYSNEAYEKAYLTGPLNLLKYLERTGQRLKRIIFVSSTGVYQESEGGWVDESSCCINSGPTCFLCEGEQVILTFQNSGMVVRFGGIYGPGRTSIITSVLEGSAKLSYSGGVYSNRVHLDDCVGILNHLLFISDPRPIYNGVDCFPAERNEVLNWLTLKMGLPPLRMADISSSARGNKRCSNKFLIDSGYQFIYPTFREGFESLIEGVIRHNLLSFRK